MRLEDVKKERITMNSFAAKETKSLSNMVTVSKFSSQNSSQKIVKNEEKGKLEEVEEGENGPKEFDSAQSNTSGQKHDEVTGFRIDDTNGSGQVINFESEPKT